jgi:hypothetical protein
MIEGSAYSRCNPNPKRVLPLVVTMYPDEKKGNSKILNNTPEQ